MADNIEVKLFEHSKSMWREIFTVVKDSIVYMDNNIAEILHWSGQTLDLIEAGAKNVQSIDFGVVQSGGKGDENAVFITSSLLHGKTVENLQNIIQSSYFQHCSIFCTISDADHDMALKREHNENESYFEKFKKTVEFWMNNMYATTEIRHIPFIYANIVPGLFFMPSFSTFFPILPSDMPRIQEWLRTKGDHRIFNSLSEVEIHHLPHTFQVRLKLLASALCDFFEALDLTENCYGIGHTAKMLASEVANLSAAKTKKAGGGHCSVIFIDRTLDVVQSSSHSACTLAEKILEMLPKLPGHSMDVMVDMSFISSLGKTESNIIVPGSLAHDPSNNKTHSILSSMFKKISQDSLLEIRHQLLEILKVESFSPAKESYTGKVTAEKLLSLMEYFRNNLDAFLKHSALLQLAMAAINSLQHENNSHQQELHSTEKILQLNLNEDDSPSCLSHILTLLKNVSESRSYYFEDIMLLILFVYSLVGQESLDSLEEENKVKTAVINNVLSRTLKVKTNIIIDNETDGEDIVRSKIAKCFERLSGLRDVRGNLTLFKDVFTLSSPMHDCRAYEPIIKQIVDKVFDPKKPEISDIEFKSTRLKDYIKSGFSLFMNVRKPHPSDHPVLFLFVVGGVTSDEVQQINDVLRTQNIKTKVLIGSTKIMNSQDMLRSFFCQDNTYLNTF